MCFSNLYFFYLVPYTAACFFCFNVQSVFLVKVNEMFSQSVVRCGCTCVGDSGYSQVLIVHMLHIFMETGIVIVATNTEEISV